MLTPRKLVAGAALASLVVSAAIFAFAPSARDPECSIECFDTLRVMLGIGIFTSALTLIAVLFAMRRAAPHRPVGPTLLAVLALLPPLVLQFLPTVAAPLVGWSALATAGIASILTREDRPAWWVAVRAVGILLVLEGSLQAWSRSHEWGEDPRWGVAIATVGVLLLAIPQLSARAR